MVLKLLLIFIIGEIIAVFIFAEVWRWLGPEDNAALSPEQARKAERARRIEVFKGILERFVVSVGLVMNYQGVLTLYAALKLGNRLRHEESKDEMSDDESNRVTNYFLIGNLLSILLCLIYIGAAMAWDAR